MLILVRGRPRAGAEISGKAIGWNRPPREDLQVVSLAACGVSNSLHRSRAARVPRGEPLLVFRTSRLTPSLAPARTCKSTNSRIRSNGRVRMP